MWWKAITENVYDHVHITFSWYDTTSKAMNVLPSSYFLFHSPSFRKIAFPPTTTLAWNGKAKEEKQNRKGVNVTANQPSQQQNETVYVATGLSNGSYFGYNPFRENCSRPLTLLLPGERGKFCWIFRSPAYLLQFYDRKSDGNTKFIFYFPTHLYVDPRFSLSLTLSPSSDTSSFFDAGEKDLKYIFRINILEGWFCCLLIETFFERVVLVTPLCKNFAIYHYTCRHPSRGLCFSRNIHCWRENRSIHVFRIQYSPHLLLFQPTPSPHRLEIR